MRKRWHELSAFQRILILVVAFFISLCFITWVNDYPPDITVSGETPRP